MRGALILLLALPVAAAPAKRVYAGVYLHDVTKLDQKDGVFDVDLELWAKWLGEFDAERLVVANGAGDLQRTVIGQESDGEWHSARWRVRGTLRGEFPLQRFPFDSQTLAVQLELPASAGELVPDLAASGVRSHFSITGWRYDAEFFPRISTETYRSDLGSLANEGRPTSVNRVSFEVAIHRPLLMVALKLFLPLLIILMVAMLGLFLHPELVEARASIGVTALLSCFAFQFTIAGTLPDVAYLTVADGLFLVAYVVASAALVTSILSYFLHRAGREAAAVKLDRTGRVIGPLLCLLPALLLMRSPSTAPPPLREPLQRIPTPESARTRVRIGTLSLPTILASPVYPGLFWDVVHKEPDGSKRPVFVDAAASVASDTLHFLAGGEQEVAWRIRPEARWSDGKPLEARDLQFGFELSKDPDVVEVRAPSSREIVVRYADRLVDALEAPAPYPSRALDEALKKGGYQAVRDVRAGKPIPTLGPYRVVEFTADQKLVVTRNPHFIGAPPALPDVEVIHYPDSAHAVAAFESGEVDVLAPNTSTPEDTRALKQRRPDAVAVRPGNGFIFLAPDLTTPLLQKREVRRAILMGIDRQRLRREIYGDEGRVAEIPIPGELSAGMAPTPYDPAQARALLEKAGAIGMELPIVHGASAVDTRICQRVADDLAQIGLKPVLEKVERVGEAWRERKWKGLFEYALRGSRESSAWMWWNLPQKDGRYLATMRHEAYDDTVAALVERERRALYPERREQLRDRLFAEYAARLPTLPLLFASERMVVDPKLRGWDNGPQARFGEGIERWYFAK